MVDASPNPYSNGTLSLSGHAARSGYDCDTVTVTWGRKGFKALGPWAWGMVTLIFGAALLWLLSVDVNWGVMVFFGFGWSAAEAIRAVKRRRSARQGEDSQE